MKKLLYCAAALATLLFAGSCQKENLEPEAGGVTYTITLADGVQTKGSSGYTQYDLYYEVYKTVDATELENLPAPLFENEVKDAFTDHKATVTLDLLNDQDYTILFWANMKDAKKADGNSYFDTSDLREVKINGASSNDNNRDAFCGMDQLVDFDANLSKTVELKRPFAQLNIATEIPAVGYDITPKYSYVKVSKIPTVYNVATAAATEEKEVEFKTASVPTNKKITVGTDEYSLVAMNYLLVPQANISVYYAVETANGIVSNTIKNVPVKPNYRTNIIGNLLTSDASYTVEIKPGFEDPTGGNMEVLNDGIVKNINGNYEITNANGLVYAIENLFEDTTVTGTFYILNSIDMTGVGFDPATVGKPVDIVGEMPVVTRSSSTTTTTGITITGLSQPLIATVQSGATVSFSNIFVEDYASEDPSSSAALVGENYGYVLVSGCEATDESNNEVELVGNNNGKVVDASDSTTGGGLAYLQHMLGTNVTNITLSSPVVIPADSTIVLDLKGKTVSQIQAQTGAYSMIDNKGTLTLKNGTLTYADNADLTSDVNYVSNTISNSGTLTIEDGVTVINNSGEAVASYGYPHPIDNSGTLVIKGGTFTNNANYSSMRIWCTTDDNTNVTIHGGEFNGSIDLHNVNGSANKGTLTINAGTFNADTYTKSAVRLLGFGVDVDELHGYIKGGTFKGKIALRNYVGGEFNAKVFEISGGTFSDDPTEFLAEGYMACKDEDIYSVFNPEKGISTAAELFVFAQTVNNGNTFYKKTVKLTADIDLKNKEWTPIGNSTNKFQGTFDGQNHTISNLSITGSNSYVGLFGFTTDGEIKNLTVNNAKVSGRLGVGVVAGSPYTSKYTNIKVTGHVEVNGMAYVGGVGGRNAYANWTDVTVAVDETSYVKANSVENETAYRTYVGGVCGFNGEGGHSFKNITSNIDVTGSTIDVGGLFGIAHYGNKFENCSCSGDVEITDASEAADAEEIGGIAGVWNNGGADVVFNNCSFNGTLKANITEGVDLSDNTITGNAYSANGSGKLIIDGKAMVIVDSADKLVAALEESSSVKMVTDIKIDPANMSNAYGTTGINVKNGQTIDGGGHTLDIKGAGGTWDSGINTTGGLIKNITVTGSFRGIFINHNSTHSEKVVLENVTIDGTTYTISCDQGMNQNFEATGSTFKGWTSYAATIGTAKFTDCYFGEGSGYAYCRPYAPTEFVGCEFEAGFTIEPVAAVTFENCTLGGVALTAENLATLVTNTSNATVK